MFDLMIPKLGNASDGLSAYRAAVSKFDFLSPQEEIEAFEKMHAGHIEYAHKLVCSHLNLVVKIARSYKGYKSVPQADLIQEGNIGLMVAVKNYDPVKSNGARLASFATVWIHNKIRIFITENYNSVMRLVTTKTHRKLFFRCGDLNNCHDPQQKQQLRLDIAEKQGVTIDDVRNMEQRLRTYPTSLDMDDEDDENPSSHALRISPFIADDTYDPAQYTDQWDMDAASSKLHHAINIVLNDREQDIIKSRVLLDGKSVPLHELATKYGVSQERIRQVEVTALNKLKAVMVDCSPN